jgi:hypothetical protein
MTPDEFEALASPLGFEWTSAQKDSMRLGDRAMTLLGKPAYEAVARFADGKLNRIAIAFYARGDAGAGLDEKAFTTLVSETIATVTTHAGKPFTPRGKDPTNAVKAEGVFWDVEAAHYLLEYSFTKAVKSKNIPFRAEFIRLEASAPQAKMSLLTKLATTQPGRVNLNAQIKRDPATGDVWLPMVPMVDQGQKGYCAVACVERVMRYLGQDVDANELAQVANSDPDFGTNSARMLEALKKLTSRLKVRVKVIEQVETRRFFRMIDEYNRVAKKAKKEVLPDPDVSYFSDFGSYYRMMDAQLLKEVRTKNKADVSSFSRDVQQAVNSGVPLLWSVQLGMFPEPGLPQVGGGHMRLIIGYNAKTNEIIYSDSWGAGHEQKRMPLDNAWTITVSLAALEPTPA